MSNEMSGRPFVTGNSRVRKLLILLPLGVLLTACSGAPKGPIATTEANLAKVRCTGWKPLTYDSKEDTVETAAQVREHNAFGIRRGCWTAKRGKK